VASHRGGWWLCCAIFAVFVACSGKKRPFSNERYIPEDVGVDGDSTTGGEMPPSGAAPLGSPGASSEGPPGGALPIPASSCAAGACDAGLGSDGMAGSVLSALGQPCVANAECESNVCAPDVDDFSRCCDRPCGEAECERCSTTGVCGSPPAVASECPEVACPADDVCRDFQQAISAGTCSETGACGSQADCTFDWTAAAREGQACECDAAGCKLAVPEPCTRNEDCASAVCRATLAGANICCAQACGPGQVCRADGSGCDVAPVCTNGQLRCDGASYQQCVGGQWITQRECGALGCDPSLNGCRRSAGETCTSSAECGEGACRETETGTRVCCTAACDTACRRCTATGTACQLLNDDAACGVINCPADSTCRDFPASITQNRCNAGSCGAPADLCDFTARNSGQSCSNTSLCDTAGNCNVPKRDPGAACTTANQCASGQCIGGVCCETACDGPNASCATGECLCSGGLERCNSACVDVSISPDHCGTCGAACLGGQCSSGVCRARIAAGNAHTCIMLPNLGVRCWGQGSSGKLGYGNTNNIGDNETPASAGFVSTGGTVTQLAAGGAHTCALLSTGDVRCWGLGLFGRLGYGNTNIIGDDELPSSVGTVSVGGPVAQVVAGNNHTCALLDTGSVRCWGSGASGQLGYGNTSTIGDDETPAAAGNVDVGGTVLQITAGSDHTCALLAGGAVRCWGENFGGQLGYGNTNRIGDDELPSSIAAVNVGGTVTTLAAGGSSTCALLTTGAGRCWGSGLRGQLGYGNTNNIGDNETPASAGSVNVGGNVAQITAGGGHTCALLEAGMVRCWGGGASGALGYGNTNDIGDNELPSTAGDVILR
jgi:hypothetical protein